MSQESHSKLYFTSYDVIGNNYLRLVAILLTSNQYPRLTSVVCLQLELDDNLNKGHACIDS